MLKVLSLQSTMLSLSINHFFSRALYPGMNDSQHIPSTCTRMWSQYHKLPHVKARKKVAQSILFSKLKAEGTPSRAMCMVVVRLAGKPTSAY